MAVTVQSLQHVPAHTQVPRVLSHQAAAFSATRSCTEGCGHAHAGFDELPLCSSRRAHVVLGLQKGRWLVKSTHFLWTGRALALGVVYRRMQTTNAFVRPGADI